MSNIQAAKFAADLRVARNEASGQQVAANCFATVFESLRQKSRETASDARQRKAEVASENSAGAQRADAQKGTDRSGTKATPSRAERLRQNREEARSERSQAEAKETAAEHHDAATKTADIAGQTSSSETAAPEGHSTDGLETTDHATDSPHDGEPQGLPVSPENFQVATASQYSAVDAGTAAGTAGGGSELLSDHAISLPPTPGPTGSVNAGNTVQQLTGPRGVSISTPAQSEAESDPDAASTSKSTGSAPLNAKNTTAGTGFQNVLTLAGRGRTQAAAKLVSANLSTNAASGTVSPEGAEAPEELARVLRSQVGAKHSSLMLRLDPPELGRMRVDVRMHDQAMTVRFQTETEAGHDAIQGRLHELTSALEQQGVKLERVDVEYRPPPAPDARQEGQPQSQQQTWGDAPSAGGQQSSSNWREPTEPNAFAEARSLWPPEERIVPTGVDCVV